MNNPKKILFAPLDWGLGHASRCIPLIQECLDHGHKIIIAGNQSVTSLVQSQFPELQAIELKGYNVIYTKNQHLFALAMLLQLPKFRSIIKFEHKWLDEQIDQYKIDLVISDNRYGLFTTRIPCIFITHQLQIQVPQSSILQRMVARINHRYIKRFTTCLVPDYENHPMSGNLSRNLGLTNVQYIGNISRFTRKESASKKIDILVLLSGPEPQRSLLEQKLLNDIELSGLKILLIRGKPESKELISSNSNITVMNHLNTSDLQEAILGAGIIICRSGYSTVMDLIKLNVHAILIPTPGQTEQEYLGAYLMEQKWFVSCSQENLSLRKLIDLYNHFQFSPFPLWELVAYKHVIKKLLDT